MSDTPKKTDAEAQLTQAFIDAKKAAGKTVVVPEGQGEPKHWIAEVLGVELLDPTTPPEREPYISGIAEVRPAHGRGPSRFVLVSTAQVPLLKIGKSYEFDVKPVNFNMVRFLEEAGDTIPSHVMQGIPKAANIAFLSSRKPSRKK